MIGNLLTKISNPVKSEIWNQKMQLKFSEQLGSKKLF